LLIAESELNEVPASVMIGAPYTLGILVRNLVPIDIGSLEFSLEGKIGFV